MREMDAKSEVIRNLLVYFRLELWRVVADDRDAWSRENGGENGNEKKKKSEIIYIYYCIESCALRLRFKLVRL